MLPVVVIHNAVSVDGRTDWFKPDIEKFYDLTNIWNEDATLAGSDTLLAAYGDAVDENNDAVIEEPRDTEDSRPLLVVADSRGRLRMWHMLKHEEYWRDAVALCTRSTPQEYLDYLSRKNVTFIIAGEERVDFKVALDEVNIRYKVNTVRVDSGGSLNGVLLRAGLVHEVSVVMHPCLVGGTSPRSLYKAPDLESADGVVELKLSNVQKLEGDLIWLRYEVIKK